jgi:hypothetical protein
MIMERGRGGHKGKSGKNKLAGYENFMSEPLNDVAAK